MKKLEELGVSPSPWVIEDDGKTIITHVDCDDDVYGEVAVCDGGPADKANARLIVLAPNMYKQLYDQARFCRFLISTKQPWLVDRAKKQLERIEVLLKKAEAL